MYLPWLGFFVEEESEEDLALITCFDILSKFLKTHALVIEVGLEIFYPIGFEWWFKNLFNRKIWSVFKVKFAGNRFVL